jgi:hypothetical protein
MATVTYHEGYGLDTLQVFDGTATIATSAQIRIEDGLRRVDYYGTFSYDQFGFLAGGRIGATDYYERASFAKAYEQSSR